MAQYKYSYDEEKVAYTPRKLETNRSAVKFFLLTLLTCGIYSIIFFISFSFDIDKVAPKPDRSKTMTFLFVYIFSLFTLSIVLDIWLYGITRRMEEALEKRKIDYNFGTATFWGWHIFGSLILIGPFVYYYQMFKAMNLLCESYNEKPVLDQ